MLILPAVDLLGGKAVRLTLGDYDRVTEYGDDPVAVARTFRDLGAEAVHLVDLDGARTGATPHLETILSIRRETGLFCEVGGGIRSLKVLEQYLSAGVDRAILGTAAVTDPAFRREAVKRFGDRVAVGVDVADGKVAIRGWKEKSEWDAVEFCRLLASEGVSTVICTDISRDGALSGAGLDLYRSLLAAVDLRVVASGGVSSLEDVTALKEMGLYGAIVGKAYYEGKLDLKKALEAAR